MFLLRSTQPQDTWRACGCDDIRKVLKPTRYTHPEEGLLRNIRKMSHSCSTATSARTKLFPEKYASAYITWNMQIARLPWKMSFKKSVISNTRWFKYDRDYLCVNKSQFVPVIFEPPCITGKALTYKLFKVFHFFILQDSRFISAIKRRKVTSNWKMFHFKMSGTLRYVTLLIKGKNNVFIFAGNPIHPSMSAICTFRFMSAKRRKNIQWHEIQL
jgi:hypothetical protein